MKLNKGEKYLFVVSDVHSFAKELKAALKKAGFDKNDKNHTLVVCGDIFDRGPGTMAVYRFLKSIPKSRRVLIRGNHEDLFLELLKKDWPGQHDLHNGTIATFCDIAGGSVDDLFDDDGSFLQAEWLKVRDAVAASDVAAWLSGDEWRDWYERGKFVFVHSFIPVRSKPECVDSQPSGSTLALCSEYDPDWRDGYWPDARWGCPYKLYDAGLFAPERAKGKVLVVGHWHTSAFFEYMLGEYDRDGEIYCHDGLIGIDGGVRLSLSAFDGLAHDQNVLVIDGSGKCYDKYGRELGA